jgi:hypothetical protein
MTTYRKTLLATGSAGALLAGFALSAPANAGDWNQGAPTLKGSYAAKVKAVPAPAPIPEYEAKYYIGVHGTFTAASSGTISTPDVHIETKSISDTANFFNAGFTIGRYITPSLRAELAFDFRPLRGVTATSILLARRTFKPLMGQTAALAISTATSFPYLVSMSTKS